MKRPDPVRWLWYAFGGGLPARCRTWVLRDLTCRTWPLRHTLRGLVQVAPIVALLLLIVPGSLPIRAAAVLAGLLLGLLYSAAYQDEITEHRVAKAGYPVGTAHRALFGALGATWLVSGTCSPEGTCHSRPMVALTLCTPAPSVIHRE